MKILMVGLGGVGQRHLRNIRSLLGDEVQVAAYRVRGNREVLTDKLQIETGASLEEKYQLSVFHDLDQALAWGPEAVFICNPSSLHIPVAMSAARAGCHLFVEKPLSHNLDEVESLISIVEEKKLTAVVAYQLRFHPCITRVRQLLANNAVGPVLRVQAEVGEYLPGWHTYEDYRQMYASRSDMGGGVILSQIHEMDYLYWMFGTPARVYALGGKRSNLEIDVEDTAGVLMDCRGVPVSLQMDYLQRPPSRTLKIVGNDGVILADLRALTVQVFDAAGALAEDTSYEGFERNRMFLDELAHFFACISGREKPLVSLRDGLQSLRMALAAKQSLAEGKPVDLE